MANSKIVITFGEDAVDNNTVYFERQDYFGVASAIPILETFKPGNPRTAVYTVPTPPVEFLNGIQSAINYVASFNLDYNSQGIYIVTRDTNVVTIEYFNDAFKFKNFASNNTNITAVITNVVQSSFSLSSYEVVQDPDNICSKFILKCTTTELATKYYINDVEFLGNVDNPIEIPLNRGTTYSNIVLENATGNTVEVTYNESIFYDYLVLDYFQISIINWLNGATITVSPNSSLETLELEYSLDNVNWQVSNSFSGQGLGDGVLYIRDKFGCKKSKEYTVTEYGTINPYIEVSQANSIPFALREDIDNCNVFRNEKNTLSFEEENCVKYCDDMVLFTTCDKTELQIHSNFENVTAKLRKEDETEFDLNVTKQTDNLYKFYKLDGFYDKHTDGKTKIYFDTGYVYDKYDNEIATHILNGNLPDFAILGEHVSIDGLGVFEIADVLFDKITNKRAIIINFEYLKSVPTAAKIESVYNLLPFEVYKINIDWSLYDTGIYDVIIHNNDTINGDVYLQSENISLEVSHENTLGIKYYNTNNRDIFYKFGIEHFIRVPYIRKYIKPKEESEINIQDVRSSVVKSTIHRVTYIEFNERCRLMTEQLEIALSSENVFINDLGYIKDGDVDISNIEGTNMYAISANMLSTNITYSTKDKGVNDDDYLAVGDDNINIGQLEIPTIITDGTNFIKS